MYFYKISQQVSLRNSQPSVAAILIFVNLPSPKGTAIVWANLDPLSLFLNVLSLRTFSFVFIGDFHGKDKEEKKR